MPLSLPYLFEHQAQLRHEDQKKSHQRITLHEIFAGAFPFVICMALVTLLLVFVPQLSLMFK